MEIVEYGRILKKRLWLIALCVLIACVATGIYSHYFVRPLYQASTKLIVNQSQDSFLPGQPLNFSDINANILLVNTYKEIIQSRAVMEQVAKQHPEFKLNAEQLIRLVNVSSLDDTQVMTLTVKAPSYREAALIVNAVSEIFKQSVPEIMNIDNVQILNEADTESRPAPVGGKLALRVIISFIASLILSVGAAFLLEYLDDTLKTEQEAELLLGAPVLAAIRTIATRDISPRRGKRTNKKMKEAPYATANQ